MFRRVLVANRGEIAIRVMRTCRELGIPTVAVYSEPDRTALHTTYATEAYPIGPAASAESYLRIDRIIDAARRSGADAVHPGYGFLSENAGFAKACQEANLTFIGPSAEAIELMGNKTVARQKMIDAGVPVVPGTAEPLASMEEAIKTAEEIGFPLMLKAAAGGGGRGMRRVTQASEFADAYNSAEREAKAAFGDGSIYIERLILNPRHIEVQIFGDGQGKVIHLNERECSIQRRNQKVIEEAPSPFVDQELRDAMGAVAIRAGESVNYCGAGTVEFLVDEDRSFYFLEMNTRLQVEHPVTELTTGYDLVLEQLKVAAGEPMSVRPVAPRGSSLEARIYAENPAQGFRPSPGVISYLRSPGGYGVRVDTGVYAGFEVTPHYDPMLMKLVVHGVDRPTAIRRMDRALSELVINGIDTNVTFLRRIVQHEAFMAGRTDTAFIDRHIGAPEAPDDGRVRVAMIAAAIRQYEFTRELGAKINQEDAESQQPSAWRRVERGY